MLRRLFLFTLLILNYLRIMSDQQVRVSRPVTMEGSPSPAPSGGKNWLPWVIAAIVVIVLIGGVAIFRDSIFKAGKMMEAGKTTTTKSAGSSGYQAVFLTNGQVYFGKLSNSDGQFPMLKDIYYLQVTQPPLQGSQQQGQQQTQAQAQPQISLVKLGQELHGPVDEMSINRDQILFWEDMKDDSQVVKAIMDYKANPQGSQQQAPAK